MRRFVALVPMTIVGIAACGGGSSSGGATATTFDGALVGVASLSGEGAGHLCGRQGNGSYLATMRTTVAGKQVVVSIRLPDYAGPANYSLGPGAGSVTLTEQDVESNPVLGGTAWRSTSGQVSIDQADEYAGSLDATLDPISRPYSTAEQPAETLKGHWSCVRSQP